MHNVERAYAVDEVVGSGHVAPGAEFVDLDTDRVDDVVDAVLHDYRAGACDVHLDGEAGCALQAVCRVRNAVVFAENARAAYRTPDNRHVVEALAGAAQREVVGPVLRRDGIAEADEREVLLFGEDVDRIEEVDPVCFAGEIVGEACRLREVAVAVLAAREWARDCCTRVHLREAREVQAHVESLACGHVEGDFVAQNFFASGNCARGAPAERDGGRHVFGLRAVYKLRDIFSQRISSDIRLANRHGFRAGEVREMEPQLVARKACANRVTKRQVLRVGRFLAVGDGGRVAPAGNPFRELLGHAPKIDKLRVISQPLPFSRY